MTTSDKLREFGQKVMREYGRWWGVEAKDADKFVSDLTALISEGYVEKAKYDEAVRQRDELREALKQLVHLHGCEQEGLLSGQPTPEQWYKAVERAEAAIKNTEQ